VLKTSDWVRNGRRDGKKTMDSIEARIDYLEEREGSVTAERESLLESRGNQPKPRVASASVPRCPPNAHELDHLSLLKWQALSGTPVLPSRLAPVSIPLLHLSHPSWRRN
jgi:hypothetical protein